MTVDLADLQISLDERGLTRFMATRIRRWDAATATLEVVATRREELEGGAAPGHWHGGAIGALLDTAATYAVFASGAPAAPTASYRIDLLRPATEATLAATAVVRRLGRTLATVDVEASAGDGRLVALGRFTFVVAA